jgi:hypothetical protein
MRRQNAILLVALMGFAALTGCANARYVKTDQGSGVVAMPANTNTWPNYYRDHAEALIRQKCPAGYEVVYEEEAVVGQVTDTHTDTKTDQAPTLNLGGLKGDSGKDGKSSSVFAGVGVPLGQTREKTDQTTNSRDLTEWRIYYRAKSASPPAPAAAGASFGPMGSRPSIAPPS